MVTEHLLGSPCRLSLVPEMRATPAELQHLEIKALNKVHGTDSKQEREVAVKGTVAVAGSELSSSIYVPL